MTTVPPIRPIWERFDTSRTIGRHVLGYGQVSSTMDVAWELAESGAAHGTAVLAETQSQGRGRFGRRWTSEPGDSLLVSLLLRHPDSDIGPLLPVQTTLAVHGAIRELCGLECSIKWPNDLHVDGRKLCGILVEVRTDTAGRRVAVIGVGLNLNLDPASHEELRETATSIRHETGTSFTDVQAAEAVFAGLAGELSDPPPAADTLQRWKQHLDTLGKRVTVYQREGPVTGMAEDVGPTGNLLLRSDDGVLRELAEGDVSLSGPLA